MKPFTFSNRVLGAAVGVLAVVYLYLAFTLEEFTAVSVPVQPATLPKWLGAVLLVLAAVLFFQKQEDTGEQAGSDGDGDEASKTGGGAPARPAAARPALGRLADPRHELALFAASIGLYIALLEPLGFLISTTAYIAATTWYLGYRRHWANALVAVGVSAVLYFAMSDFLRVALPTGPLPF
ncbi:tripartite tricarboxylate transporter TctB family protein [Nocardiopsis sp. RSe5-2]|uniref:Tripartite tricarboxylate transporter TctB family protein n=1 Tax=Nocardiopsis endophytica TaxID=3018445 RepID=A0ABT4UE22_9ACTN|nr:tripartite tricarboxylate transporter TctB family protein [Nocardiopsis endophytica]MDA2815206.1 tripartite tricarboxylate transporter TctB family protein [Nocardiopsis endophytica]